MAGPVTEIACLALKPGVDFLPESSEGYKAIHHTAVTSVSQPGGQRVYFGAGIEDPTKVWFFLDWDSIGDHMNWQKNKDYGPMLESLQTVVDFSKTYIKHVSVTPFPPVAVLDNTQSAVTEVLSLFFAADISEDAKAAANSRVEEFIEKSLKPCPDFKGASYGWSVENDVPIVGEDGATGSLLLTLIGWPSLDAHAQYRETDLFKDNIALLRGIPGVIKRGVVHVSSKSIGNSLT